MTKSEARAECVVRVRVCILGAVLGLLASGCATPERLAHRIVTAPNLHGQRASARNAEQWVKALSGGTNRFASLTIPVGPPEARLKVLQLPAGEYGLRFVSSISSKPNGKKEFALQLLGATNCAPGCVKPRATVVVLHGYMLGKESMIPWAFFLAEAGYRVVLVDIRGHGQSSGQTFSCGKYETGDLVQVLDYLAAQGWCDGQVGVLGISFGADLGLHWAARDPRVRTVVAIAPYNRPEEAFGRFAHEMGVSVSPRTLAEAMSLAASRLDLKWADWSGEAAVRQMSQPALLIGGEKDTISRPEDINALRQAAPRGTESIVVSKANHFVVGYSFHEIGEPVKAWFGAHLTAPVESVGSAGVNTAAQLN